MATRGLEIKIDCSQPHCLKNIQFIARRKQNAAVMWVVMWVTAAKGKENKHTIKLNFRSCDYLWNSSICNCYNMFMCFVHFNKN